MPSEKMRAPVAVFEAAEASLADADHGVLMRSARGRVCVHASVARQSRVGHMMVMRPGTCKLNRLYLYIQKQQIAASNASAARE